MDGIQEQLTAMQQTLQQLIQSSTPTTVLPPARPVPSVHTAPPFEGPSSFHHETLVARDAAFSAVATSQAREQDDHVSAALSSLRRRLDHYHAPDAPTTGVESPTLYHDGQELLPVELVVALIRKVKARPPFFLVSQSWASPLQVESLCQSIYFPLFPMPSGSLPFLHGLLYFIIRDYLHEENRDLAQFDLLAHMKFCERHFSAALSSYEMVMAPTVEKVQALLIAIVKSQEEFDIQRCWTYLSIAFNMCQTLGLHRSHAIVKDPFPIAESKRHAFWSLYTIDKNLSLNIGLASHFQDHDIDADLFTPSNDPQQRPWDLMSLVTVEFAGIQGRVYDQLYSTAASKARQTDRMKAIDALSAELIAVRDKLLSIDVSPALYSDSLHGMAACADFITYSVLTVIYRAQTGPGDGMGISLECYKAGSMALHSHLKCFTYFRGRQTHKQMEYVNRSVSLPDILLRMLTWNSILLYPSFAPFAIVFTHAITTSNTADLALLQETLGSLELIKDLSPGAKHLHAICEAFVRTAQVLVDTQQTLTGLEQLQDGSLFMPPIVDGPANVTLPDVSWPENTFDSAMNQEDVSMFLNDFLGTNRPVMDILNASYLNYVPE